MGKFISAMPVPTSFGTEGPAFVDEVRARWDDYVRSRRRLGVTRERGWLEQTPAGDLFILLLEGADPVEANRQFAASQDPFDVWFKERAGGLLGADLSQPIPVHPEPIYHSVPEGSEAQQSVALAIPLVQGKTEAHRRIAEEVKGSRKEGFDAFHQRAGVLEDWWIQETPMGDLALVYLESDDLAAAMRHLATSEDGAEVWFRRSLLETQGVDWTAPPPPLPEIVFDWRP